MAITSLVLGIVSFCFDCLIFALSKDFEFCIIGAIIGVLAIIFGVSSLRKKQQNNKSNKQAILGMILGIIPTIIGGFIGLIFFVLLGGI